MSARSFEQDTFACINCGRAFDKYRVDDCPQCGVDLAKKGKWRRNS